MSNPYLVGILFVATAVSADPTPKSSGKPDAARLHAERRAECHTRGEEAAEHLREVLHG